MYGFKHERIDKSVKFANGKVYINGIEGFLELCKREAAKISWCK
jgi:transposase